MLIRFLRDYRGALTGENFFQAGEIVFVPRGAEIVKEGAAEPETITASLIDEVGLPIDVPPGDLAADLAAPDVLPDAPTEPARGRGRRA